MRLFIFLILAVFSVQTFDFPPAAHAQNPKTCCGRSICLCKHAQGARCDFKQRKAVGALKAQAAPAHGDDCPFHKGMKKSEMGSAAGKEIAALMDKIKNAPSVFSQAPCHTNAPKSTLPQTARDYEAVFSSEFPAPMFREFVTRFSSSYLSSDLPLLDRPPNLSF